MIVSGTSVEQWFTADGGRREIGFRAEYTLFRDPVEFQEPDYPSPMSFTWAFDGNELVLSDLQTELAGCHSAIWESRPWTLIDA